MATRNEIIDEDEEERKRLRGYQIFDQISGVRSGRYVPMINLRGSYKSEGYKPAESLRSRSGAARRAYDMPSASYGGGRAGAYKSNYTSTSGSAGLPYDGNSGCKGAGCGSGKKY